MLSKRITTKKIIILLFIVSTIIIVIYYANTSKFDFFTKESSETPIYIKIIKNFDGDKLELITYSNDLINVDIKNEKVNNSKKVENIYLATMIRVTNNNDMFYKVYSMIYFYHNDTVKQRFINPHASLGDYKENDDGSIFGYNNEKKIIVFDLSNKDQIIEVCDSSSINGWCFDKINKQKIFYTNSDEKLFSYDLINKKRDTIINYFPNNGNLDISPDGNELLTVMPDSIMLWDINSKKLKKSYFLQNTSEAYYTPDGTKILAEVFLKYVFLKLKQPEEFIQLEIAPMESQMNNVVHDKNKRYTAFIDAHQQLYIYDHKNEKTISKSGLYRFAKSPVFDDKSRFLAIVKNDQTIVIWDLKKDKEIYNLCIYKNKDNEKELTVKLLALD